MNANTKPTQSERVKRYMEDFGSITQLDAIRDLGNALTTALTGSLDAKTLVPARYTRLE